MNPQRSPVRIDSSDGTLTLEGEVGHLAAKKLILEVAAAVPGVRGIVDRLHVAPAQPMDDGTIRDHVRDAFLQEPVLETCTIRTREKDHVGVCRESVREPCGSVEVKVENGVVTLTGEVPSLSHKRLAGVLAWWVPGSRDVINGLEVVPPQEDNDDEITDAVRLVLEKDPFVNAGQIRVGTRGFAVTLEGLVANEAEKDMAENDVWYVFGVDNVHNELTVQK